MKFLVKELFRLAFILGCSEHGCFSEIQFAQQPHYILMNIVHQSKGDRIVKTH